MFEFILTFKNKPPENTICSSFGKKFFFKFLRNLIKELITTVSPVIATSCGK